MSGGWRTMPNGCRVYFSSISPSHAEKLNYFAQIRNRDNYKYKTFESFTNPNALCPVCKASVFYYENPNGSQVYFDDLGPPWPKHPCIDNGYNFSDTIGRGHNNSWISQGWKPLFVEKAESNKETGDVHVTARNDCWSVNFSITKALLRRNNIQAKHIRSLLLLACHNAFNTLSVKMHNGDREIPVKINIYKILENADNQSLAITANNFLTNIQLANCGDNYFILSGILKAKEFTAKVEAVEVKKFRDMLLDESGVIELITTENKRYSLLIDSKYAFTVRKSDFYSKLQKVNNIQLFQHPDKVNYVLNALLNNKLITFHIKKEHKKFKRQLSLLAKENSVLDIIPSDKTSYWYGEYAIFINKVPLGLFNNIESEFFNSTEQFLSEIIKVK